MCPIQQMGAAFPRTTNLMGKADLRELRCVSPLTTRHS